MTPVRIPIKIICRCGQKYAFDVYPVDGRMPAPVQCPVCGMDGTATANEIIALALGIQPSSRALQLQPQPNPVAGQDKRQPDIGDQGARKPWYSVLAGKCFGVRPARPPASAEAAAYAGLVPHLAQAVKEAVVQELTAQRRELLMAQQKATAEITELVHRLDQLQMPMQERLQTYETRIAELEKELAARSDENRELLKLKIEMIRGQLEAERTRNRMEFN
jgi:hypothetical protein